MYFIQSICNNCESIKGYLDYNIFYRNEEGELVSYEQGGHGVSSFYLCNQNGYKLDKYPEKHEEDKIKAMYDFLEEKELYISKMLTYDEESCEFIYTHRSKEFDEDSMVGIWDFWRPSSEGWHPDYEEGRRLFKCKECEEKAVTCHMGGCI